MLKNLQIHPQFCEVRMQKITGSDAPCERIKHASRNGKHFTRKKYSHIKVLILDGNTFLPV